MIIGFVIFIIFKDGFVQHEYEGIYSQNVLDWQVQALQSRLLSEYMKWVPCSYHVGVFQMRPQNGKSFPFYVDIKGPWAISRRVRNCHHATVRVPGTYLQVQQPASLHRLLVLQIFWKVQYIYSIY